MSKIIHQPIKIWTEIIVYKLLVSVNTDRNVKAALIQTLPEQIISKILAIGKTLIIINIAAIL